ncbi:MAG: 2-phospho-L-lactate guanylyltransferase [Candidatus Nezhaarchaeota archaeon]|nr:2-phospho-L-lactate guanylyltransferase [Candidatus Nezhaarchaeota archaeon]
MRIYAAVPAKDPRLAKTRLSKILSGEDRAGLSVAMLRDVLTALLEAEELSKVLVVSSSYEVLSEAARMGAVPVREDEPRSVNDALSLALEVCLREGADALLIAPSDLPLLTKSCVSRLIDLLGPPPSVVLSPSRGLVGTNVLLLSPPNAISFSFGHDSFNRHLSQALERGVDVIIYEAPELSLDVDEEEDLRRLLVAPAGRWTANFLAELKAKGRLNLGGPRPARYSSTFLQAPSEK